MKTAASILMTASLLGALTVAMGAFGAHALKHMLSPESLAIYQTAVTYQAIHSLALCFSGLLLLSSPLLPYVRFASLLLVVGIVLFSGSLVLLALGAPRWLGIITPLGGISFIISWILLALAAKNLSKSLSDKAL